jgi:hypothetical protein
MCRSKIPRGTAECPMTVTAVASPVTAEAFAIASEPAPGPAAGCRTALRGGAEYRPEPAYLYPMRRWRPPDARASCREQLVASAGEWSEEMIK